MLYNEISKINQLPYSIKLETNFICFQKYIIQYLNVTIIANFYIFSSFSAVHTTIGGISGLLDDVLSMLPQDGIFILFFDKLDSSLAFSNLVEFLGNTEFTLKFDALRVSK